MFRKVCFVFLFSTWVAVSFGLRPANSFALNPVEASSPEETDEYSLPGLEHDMEESLPSFSPIVDFREQGENNGHTMLAPQSLFMEGMFPYQANPVSMVMAAAITLAYQSWRETGEVDPEAIWELLQSTDLYAGYAGLVHGAIAQRGAAASSRLLMRGPVKAISSSKVFMFFRSIINSFSYTFAVSSGFEYFSQFWKLASQHIPEVSTVSDLVNAPRDVKLRLTQNLMNYVAHPDVQKRVANSVWHHRIYTFEFIAMNFGLAFGMMAGEAVARYALKRFGPTVPTGRRARLVTGFSRHLGRVLGGVSGGVLVQLAPDSLRLGINRYFLERKLRSQNEKLERQLKELEENIYFLLYPAEDGSNLGSYFFSGFNLESDLQAILRTRDLLFSLEAQRFSIKDESHKLLEEVQRVETSLRGRLEDLYEDVRSGRFLRAEMSFLPGMGQQLREREANRERLKRLQQRRRNGSEYQDHYEIMLDAYIERHRDAMEDFNFFFSSVSEKFGEEVDGDVF